MLKFVCNIFIHSLRLTENRAMAHIIYDHEVQEPVSAKYVCPYKYMSAVHPLGTYRSPGDYPWLVNPNADHALPNLPNLIRSIDSPLPLLLNFSSLCWSPLFPHVVERLTIAAFGLSALVQTEPV